MSRRNISKKRFPIADPTYNSYLVSLLVTRILKSGKKNLAQNIVNEAFDIIKSKTNEDPLKVFNQAMDNVRPTMEVRPRRVGGAAYQVPMPVRGPRKESLAIRWIVMSANSKSNSEFHTYAEKLASEIMDCAKGEGLAVKKRTDMERVAESNKAFSHFNW